MNHIKHIFFDLDHTLWDTDKNSELAFADCFKDLDIQLDLQTFLEVYMPINEAYWVLFTHNQISKEKLKLSRFSDTFEKLNMNISLEKMEQLSERYIHYLPRYGVLIDGAIEVLDYLKDKYTLHIITNGFNDVSLKKLSLSHIDKYFQAVITSEKAGFKKPDSRIFEYALTQAKAQKNESIMIGDNLIADIQGATQAGLQVIHYNYTKEEVPPTLKSIQQLTEILKLL